MKIKWWLVGECVVIDRAIQEVTPREWWQAEAAPVSWGTLSWAERTMAQRSLDACVCSLGVRGQRGDSQETGMTRALRVRRDGIERGQN